MPTVAELVHWDSPLALDLCAGACGLGREISRFVRFSTARLDIPVQSGDAVLLTLHDWKRVTGGSMGMRDAFNGREIAAVIVSISGDEVGAWISGASSTPILLLSELRLNQAVVELTSWLSECRAREEREAGELLEDLDGVVPAQSEPLAARLAQLTGKSVLLHTGHGCVERVCQPLTRTSKSRSLEAGLRAATAAIQRRACDAYRAPIGPIYDELSVGDLAMLSMATFDPASDVRYVSLLAHPSEFAHRDSAALAAMLATLGEDHVDQAKPTSVEPSDQALLGLLLQGRVRQAHIQAQRNGLDLSGSFIGVAVRSASDASSSARREHLSELLKESAPLLRVEEDVVVCLLPVTARLTDGRDRRGEILRCQAAMRTVAGPASIGYTAIHAGLSGARRALIEAHEALTLGESLLGPGHASTLAELCLRQLVSHVDNDPMLRELRTRLLGPMIVHDQSHKNDLLSTLQTYLDTGCRTVQTAELLGVHRNSVLYRLQRIVELSHVDLEDPDMRLLLQLALHSAKARSEAREVPQLRARETHVVWSRPGLPDVSEVPMSELVAFSGMQRES